MSWAVPKGPTLDSSIRRMAVHVEDHPIDYFDFEGIIPARQYGAGDVIVWDWGTWEGEAPTLDGRKAIEDGELKFTLKGEKLRGRFTIVRTGGRRGADTGRPFEDDSEQWLLIHKRGPESTEGWDAEAFPTSVKTGRTNDEVKANKDAIWISQAPAGEAEIDLSRAREARMPSHIEPMLATLTTKAFDDPDWLFEIKWDGFRVQAVVRDGDVRLFTRNLHDAETYFGRLLSPPSWIDAREAIVDGEVVALDENGRAGLQPPPGADQRAAVGRAAHLRAARVPAVRPAPLRRAIAPRGPARVAQAAAQDRPARASPGPLRVARGRQRAGLPCGRPGARPRGDRGQAADLALRAGPPLERVAQDQDPARAGARRRRLDAGRGQRARSRGARDRDIRGRSVALRRQGRLRLHGRNPQTAARATRAARQRRTAVRPAARAQGRAAQRDVGPPRAGHPRRARRLVTRRDRAPDLVQGDRGGPRPDDGRPRAPGRDRRGGGGRGSLGSPGRRRWRSPDAQAQVGAEGRLPRAPVGRDERGARGTRAARQGGRLAGRRTGPQAHEPRQGPLPAARGLGRGADHEARADPLLRPDRRDDPAAPCRPAAEPQPLSRTEPAVPASGRRTCRTRCLVG